MHSHTMAWCIPVIPSSGHMEWVPLGITLLIPLSFIAQVVSLFLTWCLIIPYEKSNQNNTNINLKCFETLEVCLHLAKCLWEYYLHLLKHFLDGMGIFMSNGSIKFTMVIMTSSNGNIFRVIGPLCGEFTGHRSSPFTKAGDAELWCFLWSAPEYTFE